LQVGDSITIQGAGIAGYNGTWVISNIVKPDSSIFQFISTQSGLGLSGGGTILTNIITITTAAGYGLADAATLDPYATGVRTALVAGVGVGGFNGTWAIRNVVTNLGPTTLTVYLYGSQYGLAGSGGGTIGASGSIAAGTHQVSCAFITRQGFITQAAPPQSWVAGGSKRALVINIPIGPANVVARLLMFTPVIVAPATTGNFYSLTAGSPAFVGSVMLLTNNITTQLQVDFSDAVLAAGFNANYLFTQQELGEAAFNIGYNSRLFWSGERNKVTNLLNLTFDGGFTRSNVNNPISPPLGWIQDLTNGIGGGSAAAANLPVDYGDALAITGNGATAIRGLITQPAFQDYLRVPIIARNTSYTVRVRVAKANGLAAGTLHINLQSTLLAFTTVGLTVTAAQAGANYAEFTASLTDAALVNPPTDLILQLYADGTPTNGGSFLVDSIEIYPTNSPFNYSTARVSHAFNPESYDGTTGQIQVRPNDGQQLRAGFPLRNNLYLAKDHYLCYVADDGVNEPASWAVNEVSGTIGICGPNAVDWNEEWAVFAERSGCYVCWGSDPVKLTPEIQNDASGTGKISWASINWQYAYTGWVRIDKVNKMILIGMPINGATTPNVVFMLDYRWLETAQDIANSPLVTYSAFTGKMLSHGRGRRWAVWNITANSMTFAERADGTAQPFFGNGAGNGKIYWQQDAATQSSDDGVAIAAQYQTYGCPSHMEEQMLQLGAHRKLMGYLKFRAVGAGTLKLAVTTAVRSTLLRSYTLSTNPAGDGERPVNLHGERFFVTISSTAVGTWWQLEKLVMCVKRDAAIPVRGVSA